MSDSYKTYEVRVYANGTKQWFLGGKYYREDGPAVEWADGTKQWFLGGKQMTEAEHKATTSKSCEDKVVLIDGVEYKLVRV